MTTVFLLSSSLAEAVAPGSRLSLDPEVFQEHSSELAFRGPRSGPGKQGVEITGTHFSGCGRV